MNLTDIFTGEPTGGKWRRLGEYLRSQKITGGIGVRVQSDAAGTIISAKQKKPTDAATGYRHPFKIEVETVGDTPEIRLYVGFGCATAILWQDSVESPVFDECLLKYSSTTRLRYDPFDSGTVGYSVLTASNTYGVWLLIERNAESAITNATGNDADADQIQQFHFSRSTSRILVSSTANDPTSPYGWDSSEVAFFIGRAAVDAGGVVTISQYRKSDLVLPMSDMVRAINFP